MISKQQADIIKTVTARFKPKQIGVFGSFARNEQKSDSDLDILIEFEEDVNLLDIIGLEQELSDKLGIKVDLITTRSVNENLKEYIDKDLIQLY